MASEFLKSIQRKLKVKPSDKQILTKEKRDKQALDLEDKVSIPIAIIEDELDRIFGAMRWKCEIVTPITLRHTFVDVTIHLSVWNEDIGQWITRPGYGGTATWVDFNSGKPRSDKYIPNAAAVLSLALKNAAKKFGKRLGRDLNRKHEDLLYFQEPATVN